MTEAKFRQAAADAGASLSAWSNGPGAVYAAHDHPYRKRLLVTQGDITFVLEPAGRRPSTGAQDGVPSAVEGRRVPMRPGDVLDLPPQAIHSAVVGPRGVACVEAHFLAAGA